MILAHNLADAPGAALQRSSAILRDGECHPIILMRSRVSISASRCGADITIVIFAFRKAVEDMTLVENFRPAVGHVSAARRLDRQHGPNFNCVNTQLVADAREPGDR